MNSELDRLKPCEFSMNSSVRERLGFQLSYFYYGCKTAGYSLGKGFEDYSIQL